MEPQKVFEMKFSKVYPLLVAKAVKKGRSEQEVEQVVGWLTGYTAQQLAAMQQDEQLTYEQFFANAPALHPARTQITGTVCKVKLDTMEEGLLKDIRRLDKLVDELAKGKAMEKILRTEKAAAKVKKPAAEESAVDSSAFVPVLLQAGMQAPDFALPDQDGNLVRLSDFLGKPVVLYFYPKDSTPGCTRQACAYAESYPQFTKEQAVVIGISKDSVASHQKFAQKQQLPFLLLSDPQRTAIEAYGVWQEKKLYGKVSMGVVRSSFLIGRDGKIEQALYKVKPDDNARQMLEALAAAE